MVEAANNDALSDDEIAANQLQIDSSLEAINRIAQTTTFQGRKLLDGSLDFITQGGSGFGTVSDLKIDQANLGASGSVDVNINIQSAATRATVSTTGIATTSTAANATAAFTFSDATPDAEASGTVALANAYTVGAEATGAVTFDNAYTPNGEASLALVLDTGVGFTISAVDGSDIDGEDGNGIQVIVNSVANGTASTGSYDATGKILTLDIEQGETDANIFADLNLDADINTRFSFGTALGGSTPSDDSYEGGYGPLTGGTNTVDGTSGFTLTAVNGGAADGLVGNTTDVIFTSGASTGINYNADDNELLVTVAAGATMQDIANAINGHGTFVATNTVNGTYRYDTADNGTQTDPLAGGTNPIAAASFTLEAVNGGDADGTAGNSTQITYTRGTTALSTATYDPATNLLSVEVGINNTIDQVITAINNDANFSASTALNGTSLFSDDDLAANQALNLTGGTDGALDDVLTITADATGTELNGATITFATDNSFAAGQVSAAADDDGNITITTDNAGTVQLSAVAAAISEIDGVTATISANAGDGIYDIDNDPAPTAQALAGGVFGGGLTDDIVFELTGATGSEVFEFDKGTGLDDIVQAINLVSDATGITASDDAGSLKLESNAYGSKSLVAIDIISEGADGQFESGLSSSRANGKDITATVNGFNASGNGNTLSINTATLDMQLTVDAGSSAGVNFSITGGGALFQLGPDVVSNQQARLGIGSLNTAKLGGASGRLYELKSGGDKSLTSDVSGAAKIVEEVINKVTNLRGRLGAFQSTTLESNMVSLNDTVANLQQAESSIRDADFAAESAKLTRAQILVQSGTNVLSLANQNPQNVLSLLR